MSEIKKTIDSNFKEAKRALKSSLPFLELARKDFAKTNEALREYLEGLDAEDGFHEQLNNFQFSSMERIRVETAINQVETVIKLLEEFEKE